MKLVLLESPFAARPQYRMPWTKALSRLMHRVYVKNCARDCIKRGEAPFIMHMMYPQFLKDSVPEERRAGIQAGMAWGTKADATVIYVDYGISSGMKYGIEAARRATRPIIYRSLFQASLPANPEESPQ